MLHRIDNSDGNNDNSKNDATYICIYCIYSKYICRCAFFYLIRSIDSKDRTVIDTNVFLFVPTVFFSSKRRLFVQAASTHLYRIITGNDTPTEIFQTEHNANGECFKDFFFFYNFLFFFFIHIDDRIRKRRAHKSSFHFSYLIRLKNSTIRIKISLFIVYKSKCLNFFFHFV